MTVIKDILARQIIDSRGNPTVEVDVSLGGVVDVSLIVTYTISSSLLSDS